MGSGTFCLRLLSIKNLVVLHAAATLCVLYRCELFHNTILNAGVGYSREQDGNIRVFTAPEEATPVNQTFCELLTDGRVIGKCDLHQPCLMLSNQKGRTTEEKQYHKWNKYN